MWSIGGVVAGPSTHTMWQFITKMEWHSIPKVTNPNPLGLEFKLRQCCSKCYAISCTNAASLVSDKERQLKKTPDRLSDWRSPDGSQISCMSALKRIPCLNVCVHKQVLHTCLTNSNSAAKFSHCEDMMLRYTSTFTFALREESSRTLLGFRSKWSMAGDREWRKFIPRATWWASLKTKAQGGVAPRVFWFKKK